MTNQYHNQNKFLISKFRPLMLTVLDNDEVVLVSIMEQDLDDIYLFVESKLKTNDPRFKPGIRVNLVGDRLGDIMKQKNTHNTIFSTFINWTNGSVIGENPYWYSCLGTTTTNESIKLMTTRKLYIVINYILDAIIINGGYPKSLERLLKDPIDIKTVTSVQIEGSNIESISDDDTIIRTAYELSDGPNTYHILYKIRATGLTDIELREPAPDFLFESTYKDKQYAKILKIGTETYLISHNENYHFPKNIIYYIEKDEDKITSDYILSSFNIKSTTDKENLSCSQKQEEQAKDPTLHLAWKI